MGNYVSISDITNWPSGCSDAACQNETIEMLEGLFEKIVGTWFYEKAFDIEINGNDKNRINIPIHANILSVTAIYVCEDELDPTWYDHDTSSVYLDLCGSSVVQSGSGELLYMLSQYEARGIFPRGHNNIRIVGTAGHATVPGYIKQAIIWLIEAYNDGSFSNATLIGAFESEKIGDYSYKKGLTGYAKKGIYTGIPNVDLVIRHVKRQKKAIVMAP